MKLCKTCAFSRPVNHSILSSHVSTSNLFLTLHLPQAIAYRSHMNRASQSPESPIAGPTPSRPIMAPVIEFSCLFSHDLKRKQKRWKDGRLKFHTFNKRVMVYDERANSVGDMHWQEHLIFQEGDEIYLDRGGVVVQVCEYKGCKEQDLTELLTRRLRDTAPTPESAATTPLQNRGSRRVPATGFNPPRSVPPALHDATESSQINHGAGRPSSFQTPSRGPIGRAIIPRSPFEERRAQLVASSQPLAAATAVAPADAQPPAKRQRHSGRTQKSTYATSLFGAALNLSTAPSRSTPVRQAIPRLHSINPDAQLSSSVTSLRTSCRDTRSRNPSSESPRTSALETNNPLSQTSTSLSSRTIYVDDTRNDSNSRDGENISERSSAPINASEYPRPQKRAPSRLKSKPPSIEVLEDQLQKAPGGKSQKTYQINATTAIQKRTRDASPKIRTPQLNKTTKEVVASSPALFRDQISKKHGTDEPEMNNPTQQLSQPRVELRLQPRKKRKRLMISAPLPMAMSPLQSPASMILPANEELLVYEQEDVGAQGRCKGKGKDFFQKRDGIAIEMDTTPSMCAGTSDLVPTRDDDIRIEHSILSNQEHSNISQSPSKSPPRGRDIPLQPSPLSSPSSTPFMNTSYTTRLHPIINDTVLSSHTTSSTPSVTLGQKSEEAHTRVASPDSIQKLPKTPLLQVSSPSLKLQVNGVCRTSPNSTSRAPSPIQCRLSPSHCSLSPHKKPDSCLETPCFKTSQSSLSVNDIHSSSPVSPLSPPTLLLPDAFRRPKRPSSLLQSRSPPLGDDAIDAQGAQPSIKAPCQLEPQQSSLGDNSYGIDMERGLDPSPISLCPAPAINSGVEGPSIKNHSANPDIPVTAPLTPVITSNESRILPEESCSGGTLKGRYKANLDLVPGSASQDVTCSVISGLSSGTTDTLHKPPTKGQLIPKGTPPPERNIINTNACDIEAASESQAPVLPRFRIPSFINPSNSKQQQPQPNVRAEDNHGPSIIAAITEGALQTHGCSVMPTSNLGVNRKDSLLRMGGFTRPAISSVVQLGGAHEGIDRGQYQKPGQHGQREEEAGLPGEKPTLPPVRRFPGLTRASGDPWSREAHDLFEWTRPAT